ncbi:hypothetical protein [Pseudomonas sp. LF245]
MLKSFCDESKRFFNRNYLSFGVVSAVLVIALTCYNYFSSFSAVKSSDQAIWGQFGDYFGGVLNPLLSFMALVGLLFNLRSQQEESKKASLRHDQETFDTRIFQLLALSHSSVSSIKYLWKENGITKMEYEGHRGVAFALNRLLGDFLYNVSPGKPEEMYKALKPEFDNWKNSYWSAVASYMESMLFLISYVVESGKDAKSTEFAMKAVFAQMSADEKLLMFYVMIFSPQQKILLSGLLATEFLAGASPDIFQQYRPTLLQCAVLERLDPAK